MVSRLSSLDIGTPRASAASFIQLDRQLRQKPARFIRSRFCTSVRTRKCSTRRRNAAASSSVRVLSSSAILSSSVMGASFHQQGKNEVLDRNLDELKNSDGSMLFPAGSHDRSGEGTSCLVRPAGSKFPA